MLEKHGLLSEGEIGKAEGDVSGCRGGNKRKLSGSCWVDRLTGGSRRDECQDRRESTRRGEGERLSKS